MTNDESMPNKYQNVSFEKYASKNEWILAQ